MNIFWLDEDLKYCAQYHCDKHVVKQILEYTQLLSTARSIHGLSTIYKPTHVKHPCTLWVATSSGNWARLKNLALFLCEEYTFRYNKVHACNILLNELENFSNEIQSETRPPACMPEEFKVDQIVQSYRNYYKGAKEHLFSWKKRDRPNWL